MTTPSTSPALPSSPSDRRIAAALQEPPVPSTEIGFLDVGDDLVLRRLVVRGAAPRGTVLFLHGFPETLHAWTGIAASLGVDYAVHAFDWPGYGLSSRPPVERFAYAPRDYAKVLRAYIAAAGIDRSRLVIYATDIGALPALLAALDDPGIARRIIVGDFAPFDRPAHMAPNLRSLKVAETADAIRAHMNGTSDEILANVFRRGLAPEAQFELAPDFAADMARGWTQGGVTAADALHHYYAHFTRDQDAFEAQLDRLATPVEVVWGGKDVLIDADMGAELARRVGAGFTLLPGVGHFPHLQAPAQTLRHVRAAFDARP